MSGEPAIRVFDDPTATSRAAAAAMAAAFIEAVQARGRADWATTGGSTPAGIYRELAVAPLRDAVPWSSVHAWWGDERFVPRDHPLSNVMPFDQILMSTAARAGLSGTGADAAEVELGIEPGVWMPVENVHAPQVTNAITRATGIGSVALDYEAELRAAPLAVADSGLPIFDVMLVGIGSDGHVLSVFPGSPLFDGSAWVSAVPAPEHIEPHVARLTLHPGVLEAARLPIVVAHGAGKAAILASVLAGERDERKLPAQLARRDGAIWFLDRAAAASLPDPLSG
ncbi:MAG TPA: 6-phosphogluconolactonase [Candidatus Limnocylindria bacterium]|nr:6-phosphogluconolactonase [Candidatus Limnocylindria bacterium]